MLCWSCEKNVEAAVFCPACGALLPFPPGERPDHFAVLGAERTFTQDAPALERAYKEGARAVHPDKFARADSRARRAAMQRTVALNEAWRTLRDPVARAEYLVRLGGIEVGAEDGTLRRTDAGREKIAVPAALLAEMLDKREALMDARLADDEGAVAALLADVQQKVTAAMDEVRTALDGTPPDIEAAARALVAVRYYRRFVEAADEGGEAEGPHLGPGAEHG
ncbi:MAG: Fe-S protein assembly co-chaperone HscB [Myxococcales bacterium]|nr:Fe-S protein assembly co-chaperone HscB [Myxococcales bacterium]